MSWQFSQDNQFMYMGANYYELLSGPKLINKEISIKVGWTSC